jgi:uncharacterized protein YecT (DUF1311 family)
MRIRFDDTDGGKSLYIERAVFHLSPSGLRVRILFILIAFTLAARAIAQQQTAVAAQAAKLCSEVQNLAVPTVTPASDADKEQLANCDPQDLYERAGTPAEFDAARRCALYEWNGNKHPGFNPDSSMSTLVILFANGDGVTRNVDLAIHIVCADDPPSDRVDSFDHLIVQLAKSRLAPSPARLDFCSPGIPIDDASAAFGCEAELDEDLENKRIHRLAQLSAAWTEPQKDAFEKVLSALASYADADSSAEAVTGTGYGMDMLRVKDEVNRQFAGDINRFDKGRLPAFTHRDYLLADQVLNAEYGKVMSGLSRKNGNGGFVPPQRVRETERAWLKFRDTFVEFAKLRWPQASADRWLTFLTRERIGRLANVQID